MVLLVLTAYLIGEDFYKSVAELETMLFKSMWSIAPLFTFGLSLVILSYG
jgi:hypothetical protein